MNAFPVEKLRADTPACENVLHFNNAGAALMPDCVVNAVIGFTRLEQQIGGYRAVEEQTPNLERVYTEAAAMLNASADEIAFTNSATQAWYSALHSIPFRPGDRVLTALNEYSSNVFGLTDLAVETGVSVEIVPSDQSGQIDLNALMAMMDKDVRLIALTHIPTNGGLVQPAEEVGRIARQNGSLFLLDGCQSAGQYPLDVQNLGCHFLSMTGRKYLRAPRGSGLLYVSREILGQLSPPQPDMHSATWDDDFSYTLRSDARRFENFENSFSAKLGLASALEYYNKLDKHAVWNRIVELGERLRQQLSSLKGVQVYDLGTVRGGIVTFLKDGIAPSGVKKQLESQAINVVPTTRQGALLDFSRRGIDSLVRASVHYYNTEEEIGRFTEAVDRLQR